MRVPCKDANRLRGPAAGARGKTKAGRCPAWEAFQRGAPEGEPKERRRMDAKDVGWTVAISVFVTLFVLWRVGMRLDERAPSRAEPGLCAKCGGPLAAGD